MPQNFKNIYTSCVLANNCQALKLKYLINKNSFIFFKL